MLADPEYSRELALAGGWRAVLSVPLVRDGTPVGAISVGKAQPTPFSDRQVQLLQTFAEQAVIAIENARLLNELRQSLEQQTATSEVLQVISGSPGDIEPVFATILEKAVRYCDANFGTLFLHKEDQLSLVAAHNMPPAFSEAHRDRPGIVPGGPVQAVMRTRRTVHMPDLAAIQSYLERHPRAVDAVELGGVRTIVAVPMIKDDEPIGVIAIHRQEVRPFTHKQIDLLTNFAAQAVIAIENTRLLNELRQRTDDLTELLEQQTATADVLRIISISPGELEPVFKTLLQNATHVCHANFGNLALCEGDGFRNVAIHNAVPVLDELFRGQLLHPHSESPLALAARHKRPVHVVDLRATPPYVAGNKAIVMLADAGGARSFLCVPMLKESEVVGVIVLYRNEVRPFTDKEIALVQNFAAQAVIAIENARLLNELRQRTNDLTELLEQQTATSDVLRVISSSPGDLEPVFETMLENAVRISGAKFGNLFLREDDFFHIGAITRSAPPAYVDYLRRERLFRASDPRVGLGRLLRTKQTYQVADLTVASTHDDKLRVATIELAAARTLIGVPMLKEGEVIGAIAIYRQEVRPFTEKQIALVKNFAAQAVIAIENARLLTELRQRTDELAQRQAELSVTFDNMGDGVVMFNEEMRLAAWNRNLQEILDLPDLFFAEPRTYRDYMTYLIEHGEFGDVDLETELRRYIESADRQRRVERTRPDGRVLEVRVNPVPGGGFVAIYSDVTERKKAEERVRAARDAAESALRELKAAQDRLVQTEKLASLGQLTAGIAHEIKNPLNFVNNFSAVSVELIDELREALGGVHLDDKRRKEISEIADMLQGNLDKVVQHGKRADAIVKNMLLHSRQGSGEHRPVDINALVEESLNLAYHGARAEKQGFKITLERSFDPAAGEVDLFPQEITRVLLNLISNGFYAATKRQAEADGGDYEPTLAASTKNLGEQVEIRIRDNGTGIPPEVKEKMFNPFFTTKPAGKGTGLGLSISHDIIVKQHGGSIEVDTEPGEFTEFRIVLPRGAAIPPNRENAREHAHSRG